MRFSSNNLGLFLGIIAGVLSIGISVWPGAPQYAEFENILWVGFTVLIGVGFIAAAFVADRNVPLARILLGGGAILRIGSALYFGGLAREDLGAALFDIFPALLALIAALIVGPRERRAIP